MSRENNTISNKISNTISKLESNDQLENNDSLLITKALEETFKIVKIDDNKPNLQTFLNITDGIRELTGIFYMFSTNYFDKLDSALVRDGRIDIKLNLLPPSINIIKQILQHRFNISSNDIETYFENKNIKDNTISTATIIKICKKYNNDIIKCIDEIEKISNTIDNLANSVDTLSNSVDTLSNSVDTLSNSNI
jgi:SpoVK/Ycf46/Vps4 family AAA+-type ATPase